jgi:hypothetical protein
MEIKNFNLDRKNPDSEYIRSKQDFQKLMTDYKTQRNPVWKQPLFYGVVGLASIALILAVKGVDQEKLKASNERFPNIQIQGSTDNKVMIAGSVSSKEDIKREVKNGYDMVHETSTIKETVKVPSVDSGDEPKDEYTEVDLRSSEAEPSTKSVLPHIGGNYYGAISIDKFCSEEGIRTNDGRPIASFKIQYASGNTDKSILVKGNRIPTEVCEYFRSGVEDQMVFITDVFVKSNVSEEKLPSMNFWVNV